MYNTVVMKILKAFSNLKEELFCSIFINKMVSDLKVVKKVTPFHAFQDNKNVV